MLRILSHLRTRTGHDFSNYKKSTVRRRIARRMQMQRAATLADYLVVLRDNGAEAQALFGDLLISVTTFFRDAAAFDRLAELVVPQLFEGKAAGDPLRAWVPGCATGEDAYSIAMLLLEELGKRDVRCEIQVFASDLDEAALALARDGRYPIAIEADLTEERLKRFLIRENDHYRVTRDLRDVVLFARHSLLKDPPFSRADLISCRNVLIYLDRELQHEVCAVFHFALKPDGYLFLGSSENADNSPGMFRVVERESRIYQRMQVPTVMRVTARVEPPRYRTPRSSTLTSCATPCQSRIKTVPEEAGAVGSNFSGRPPRASLPRRTRSLRVDGLSPPRPCSWIRYATARISSSRLMRCGGSEP